MRLPKLVIVALATAALAASSATADPGHGKSSGADATKCKPANVKLMGTLTSDPGSTDTSFTMTVTKSNNAGKAYKLAGTATVNVDTKTRIHRHAAGVHGNKARGGASRKTPARTSAPRSSTDSPSVGISLGRRIGFRVRALPAPRRRRAAAPGVRAPA